MSLLNTSYSASVVVVVPCITGSGGAGCGAP